MNKSFVWGLAAVILIGAGSIFYVALRPAPAKAPGNESTLSLANPYVEKTDAYAIAANYPTTTMLHGSANDSAVEAMQSFIIDAVSAFKQEAKEGASTSPSSSLEIKYLVASSARTVSYIFTSYKNGSAPATASFRTFTFDTQTGDALSLADLFVPGANYLVMLSQIARAKLPDVLGKYAARNAIAGGTAPEEKNFLSWFIDNNTLDILFAPGQVAPPAAGPQTLQIPIGDLASILKLEYKR